VGKVEFETVDGMSTGEVAPAIGSERAVCACGVSNHHLAMCGVVHVETRLIEGLGKRDVGVIRRASTDDEDDAECNARGFRDKISKLSTVCATAHHPSGSLGEPLGRGTSCARCF
jgi:hypothetical protein